MTHWPCLAFFFFGPPIPSTISGLRPLRTGGKQAAALGFRGWPVGINLLVQGGALEDTELLLVKIDSTWE